MLRQVAAVFTALAAIVAAGCAYQLNTGYRDFDHGCHCLEKITAPVAKTVAWTGGVVAAAGAGVASGFYEEAQENGDYTPPDKPSNSGNQGGDDAAASAQQGKPLR